jgi:hypothetical protein
MFNSIVLGELRDENRPIGRFLQKPCSSSMLCLDNHCKRNGGYWCQPRTGFDSVIELVFFQLPAYPKYRDQRRPASQGSELRSVAAARVDGSRGASGACRTGCPVQQ